MRHLPGLEQVEIDFRDRADPHIGLRRGVNILLGMGGVEPVSEQGEFGIRFPGRATEVAEGSDVAHHILFVGAVKTVERLMEMQQQGLSGEGVDDSGSRRKGAEVSSCE
jgi:hypothetical protein